MVRTHTDTRFLAHEIKIERDKFSLAKVEAMARAGKVLLATERTRGGIGLPILRHI